MRPRLLAFALAGVCGAATAAPIVVKDGVEISILPAVQQAAGPNVTPVTLDLEARTPEAVQRLGFTSLRGVTLVDCGSGANKFISARTFAEPNLQGAGRAVPVSGAWGKPAAGSYLLAVTEHVCAAAPAGPAMAVTTPGGPTATGASTAEPVPTGTIHVIAGPGVAATAKPAPLPPPPSSPPKPPARVALAAAPQPPPSALRIATPVAGSAVAQVAASPTQKGAQRVLDTLGSLIAPPLAGAVEEAEVGSVKVYRASVNGFASAADAKAFCAKAEAVTKRCWVRPAPMRAATAVVPAEGKKSG